MSPPDGNDLQNATVYAGIADAAIARFAAENPANRSLGRTRVEWGVILSLLLSAGSAVFTGGIVWGRVQQNAAEIEKLRDANDKNTDRLARIETKLDVLLNVRSQGGEP